MCQYVANNYITIKPVCLSQKKTEKNVISSSCSKEIKITYANMYMATSLKGSYELLFPTHKKPYIRHISNFNHLNLNYDFAICKSQFMLNIYKSKNTQHFVQMSLICENR